MKSFLYSLRYMALIALGYYLVLSPIYKLSVIMLAIIPINFLAIKYGILNKIDKDHYVTKEFILMSLVLYTSIFNIAFLLFNKVSIYVVIFVVIINIAELIYLDNPRENKTRKTKKVNK